MKPAVLFKNIHLISAMPDPAVPWLSMEKAWVAVRDGLISCVSDNRQDAVETLEGTAFTEYDGQHRLLMPALANLHGHIPMTLFRNQADDTNLHDWLFNVIFPREAKLDEAMISKGTRLGLAEMIRSGTGAAADMYYHYEAVAAAAQEAGMRLNFCCDCKIKDASGKEQVQPDLLEQAMRLADEAPDDLLRASMLVHSVYLYEEDVYPQMAQLAQSLNCPVQLHVSETRKEVVDCLQKYGQRPPAQLADFGFFKTSTLAAHCVHLNDEDRKILASPAITCVHNPASNLKLGSGFADLRAMMNAGIQVGLGTDGAASNNNLDLFRDMRLAVFLAKGLSGDASLMPAETILRMTTVDGMQGLGFDQSGLIAEGFAADLQVIDLNQVELTPLGKPASALVYSGSGSFVESLMVAGRWLMEKRELKTLDEEKVRYEAVQAAGWLNQF